ncbi:hypothetical protein AVL55_17445 [Alteromonas macleodii]|uniref:Sulfotransferase family protein n=1 Tax=Alteromonas macleodii TaxID=28108 RepID=A0A126Q3F4_ALTMA|nr:hypothetical protein [Alteromonas macleodii]AMJ99782.1 hypothetical protein AVL55_17445 [Alteromonas macleodii]
MKNDKMQKVAMMGCFRSGTNFAKALLEQNYECVVKNNVFGWKHGFLPIISSDSNAEYRFDYEKAFFITKNPFSLLSSLFKYRTEVQRNLIAPTDFKSFIRSKLIVFDQGNPNSPQLRFSSPTDFWNAMNWNYLSHKDFQHVRYERLVEEPELITQRLANKLGLARVDRAFFVPEKKVKRINDAESLSTKSDYQTSESFDKDSYVKHEYMSMFDNDDIKCVLSQLDKELVQALGYDELIEELCSIEQSD